MDKTNIFVVESMLDANEGVEKSLGNWAENVVTPSSDPSYVVIKVPNDTSHPGKEVSIQRRCTAMKTFHERCYDKQG